MAVYVDDARHAYGPRMIMCHMIADTEDELMAMIDRIEVDRKHFQRGKFPHFDICLDRRTRAIALGAVEITERQCAAMSAVRAATGVLPTPATAFTFFRLLRQSRSKTAQEQRP